MSKKSTIKPQIKQFQLSELKPARYNPRMIDMVAMVNIN